MARLDTSILNPTLRNAAVSAPQDTSTNLQQRSIASWQSQPQQLPSPSSRVPATTSQAHHDQTSSNLASAPAFSPQSTNSSSTITLDASVRQQREKLPALYPAPASLTPPDDNRRPDQSHGQQHSNNNHDVVDDADADADGASPGTLAQAGPSSDPKKPRACESCRALKVRCDFPADPADPAAAAALPCRRCAKTKRKCVVTQPTRKRQRKTDTRVAELEKKIDALTASLVASRGAAAAAAAAVMGPGAGSPTTPAVAGTGGRSGSGSRNWERENEGDGEGEGARYVAPLPPSSARPGPGVSPGPPSLVRPMVDAGVIANAYPAGKKRKLDERAEAGSSSSAAVAGRARDTAPSLNPCPGGEVAKEQLPPDMIERGLLTMAQASELLARYTNKMCPHLPAVVFPSCMTAAELRASKPVLFLAVITAASGEMPALQQILTKELMQVLADRIIVRGNKSLELVQAVQVAVIWYWPPDRFEELKFYQLVHIAAVMAIELGLGRKTPAWGGFKRHIGHAWRDHPLRKHPPPDPTSVEARRAWLTCYFMATNTAIALHRPNLIRWTPFVTESMDVLKTSPDAAPTDKYLCHLVWTHKLAEDIAIQFSMDDPASTPNLAEPRTQHVLKGFERELERYRESIPNELQKPTLQMSLNVISLYMHEVTIQGDPSDDCRLGVTDSPFGYDIPLSAPHISALSACLEAIDGIIGVFISLDVPTVRCLPGFNLVRVAYAIVVLIKIYFAASSPKSDLGNIISKDEMKVEQYLDNLLDKFRAAAAEGRSRPAARFLVVLVMIRSWFHKQKRYQNGDAKQGANPQTTETAPSHPRQSGERGGSTPVPQQMQPQQPGYPATANTPLHLLSEVATNKSAAPSRSGTRPSTSLQSTATDTWLSRPPQLMYDPVTNSATPSTSAAANNNAASSFMAGGVPATPQQSQALANVLAQAENDMMASNLPFPWWDNAFQAVSDMDYTSSIFGDGFAQAMDLTFGGFMEGGFGSADGSAMQEQGWFPSVAVGMDADLGDGATAEVSAAGGFGF